MTAAERLLQLAGTTGTAAALLMAIGAGATTGAALVSYSDTVNGTAGERLLTDRKPQAGGAWIPAPNRKPKSVKRENDEAFLLAVLL